MKEKKEWKKVTKICKQRHNQSILLAVAKSRLLHAVWRHFMCGSPLGCCLRLRLVWNPLFVFLVDDLRVNRWTRAVSPVSTQICSSVVCECLQCYRTEITSWDLIVLPFWLRHIHCAVHYVYLSRFHILNSVCVFTRCTSTVLCVCTVKVILTLIIFTQSYYSQAIKPFTSSKPSLHINHYLICSTKESIKWRAIVNKANRTRCAPGTHQHL